ncbi:MAG: hypothetical protein R3D78_04995 [Paracoccaceae bacterium]
MTRSHWLHTVFGALAGAGFWGVVEVLDRPGTADFWPGLVVFVLALSGAALAMLGEFGPRRALLAGGAIAAVAAGLVLWESRGYTPPAAVFESGHAFLAVLIVASLPVPFAMTLMRFGSAGWHDYPDLFMDAWGVVVRFASAALFASLALGVLFLLGELLSVVGLRFLTEWLREPLISFAAGGAACGMGLAVVYELSDMISPVLVLRLLRLLAPVVLLVVVIFVGALPMQGMDHLFGHLSTAAVLIPTALGAISLVSIAVDQDDAEAVQGRFMRWVVRALALMVPVLGGLLGWAFWLRISEYGWTPGRMTGAAGAAVICAYGLAYGWAALRGGAWMERIRRANIVLAMGVVGLAALWLTPLIAPERIAVTSQLARFAAGKLELRELPLAEMRFEWGQAGQAGLEALRAQAGQNPDLAARLAALEAAETAWDFRRAEDMPQARSPEARLAWRGALEVLPAGADLPEALLEAVLANPSMRELAPEDCAGGDGAQVTGCVLLRADLISWLAGEEALLVIGRSASYAHNSWLFYLPQGAQWASTQAGAFEADWPAPDRLTAPELIAALRAGGFVLEPSGVQQLRIGSTTIVINEGPARNRLKAQE